MLELMSYKIYLSFHHSYLRLKWRVTNPLGVNGVEFVRIPTFKSFIHVYCTGTYIGLWNCSYFCFGFHEIIHDNGKASIPTRVFCMIWEV